jgi:hypothetical protein
MTALFVGGAEDAGDGRVEPERSRNAFVLDLGQRWGGPDPLSPNYFRPNSRPGPLTSRKRPTCSTRRGNRSALAPQGTELGQRQDSYFNRTAEHFCSHRHTPPSHKRGRTRG